MTYKRHSMWAMAGGAIPAFVALVSIPTLVHYLGYELFAITSLIISLTIFFYIYDFGIGRSLTFFAPQPESRTNIGQNELIGSGIVASLIVGSAASIVIYYISPYIAHHWISVGKGFEKETAMAFQITSAGILPSIVSNTLKGLLEGHSKFKEANICKIFSGTAVFLAPLLLVILGNKDLADISLAIVWTRYISLALYGAYLNQVIQIKSIKINSNALKAIYEYGLWAAISGFISTMFVYGDRFVVAGYLNAEELSVYIASQDLLIRYLLIPWSMAIVLMPVFSARTIAHGEIRDFYRKQKKQSIFFAATFLIVIVSMAVFLIPSLVGYGVPALASKVVVIQVIGVFFCALSQLPLIYLYANGRPRLITLIYTLEGLLYVIVAPYVFINYGLVGACLVWTTRLIVEYILLRFYAKRVMSGYE